MIKKIPVYVPSDIKYLSEWKEYRIPLGKCIVDKQVCGCGYTQLCLTNKDHIILCSPRKSLLENKEEQNDNCFYFKSINLSKKERIKMGLETEDQVSDYIYKYQMSKLKIYLDKCWYDKKPVKLLVTYDSLPKLIEIINKLEGKELLELTKVIIDEFQLIFSDARFKANVELDLLDYLDKYCKNVVYLSGTPMLDMYVEKVEPLCSLDYYQLIWDKSRLSSVTINKIHTFNLEKSAIEIINLYRSGNGPIKKIGDKIYRSTEAVLYVNNISMITSIIKNSGLKPEEVNIITAKTSENLKKIKKCGKGFGFGRIPLKGEPNKLITICTSTAFCGVDMYSLTAKAYVFEDDGSGYLDRITSNCRETEA